MDILKTIGRAIGVTLKRLYDILATYLLFWVVYVAAEGPLWSSGGERGLFKTLDGGESWNQVLTIDDDTGVTDLEMDPRDSQVLYAASYQRRRHIWSLLAGGPGSGIHKSTDGGATWRRLESGLPTADMGKIGLAISPANPDVIYATIEAGDDEKGLRRLKERIDVPPAGDLVGLEGSGIVRGGVLSDRRARRPVKRPQIEWIFDQQIERLVKKEQQKRERQDPDQRLAFVRLHLRPRAVASMRLSNGSWNRRL